MSLTTHETRNVVFVCCTAAGESVRSAGALKSLAGVCLLGITEAAAASNEVFAEVIQVTDVHDARQLIEAARELTKRHGPLHHIVTAQETLLLPVAETCEALEVSGMSSETVRRTLDKSLLKTTLRRGGVEAAADCIVSSVSDAVRFLSVVGFPIMLKPLRGSGALASLMIRTAAELDQALELMQPSPAQPVLAEAFLHGHELCIDTITIDSEPQIYSLCCYYPSIREALEDREQKWTCIMPRVMDDDLYADFIEQGLAAVRALSVGNAFTHMEGFVCDDGRLLGFTDATLRPAGARIGPMLGFAYDVDPYHAWARVMIDGRFDGPWERQYAVGTIFLRGTGSGTIERVDGIEGVNHELSALMVDARWPRTGATKSDTYTGDGYVTIRAPETELVQTALDFIARTVHISYSHSESHLEWKERFQNYEKLNRPAWEVGGH